VVYRNLQVEDYRWKVLYLDSDFVFACSLCFLYLIRVGIFL
jgi:lipopolysaccharide biosynthesis glycosyltransferase